MVQIQAHRTWHQQSCSQSRLPRIIIDCLQSITIVTIHGREWTELQPCSQLQPNWADTCRPDIVISEVAQREAAWQDVLTLPPMQGMGFSHNNKFNYNQVMFNNSGCTWYGCQRSINATFTQWTLRIFINKWRRFWQRSSANRTPKGQCELCSSMCSPIWWILGF